MRYKEFLTEMAFPRKRIIEELGNYNRRIFEHAVKIIVLSDSIDEPHWRNELMAWTGYLSNLRLKATGNPPMGMKLAKTYLYEGPFGGNELGMAEHFVNMVEVRHRVELNVDVNQIHNKLKTFLIDLSDLVGSGKDVKPLIAAL